MATLIVRHGQYISHIGFSAPARLSDILMHNGFAQEHPCGGRGLCGKCSILIEGNLSSPTPIEKEYGCRLSCQTILYGDAVVTLPHAMSLAQIEGGSGKDIQPASPMSKHIGAAVDIGTTTMVLRLYDMSSGHCIGLSSMLNPQGAIAADVIGRIDAALRGGADTLCYLVEAAILQLITSACTQCSIPHDQLDAMVITGNTTMLYLLTARNPAALSKAPFMADCYFGFETTLLKRRVFLPDCLHAFVGADITCAILASGILDKQESALLCDIGTNGELALWHRGLLYISSTAAGPAFEGAGISCGCGSIPGAIDRVEWLDGQLVCHTIAEQRAIGLCGSGLVDAVAALLAADIIDDTGFMEDDEIVLQDEIRLTRADIRSVQLAKAATYAGIMSLLSVANCSSDKISSVFLAGGFGSHLNLRSAVRIGLIPVELADKIQVIGNAALDGAAMLLMNTGLRHKAASIRQITQHVRLDGNPDFVQRYVDAMMFEE